MKKRTFTIKKTFSKSRNFRALLPGILLMLGFSLSSGVDLNAQTPFGCNPILYQVISGQLNRFDVPTSTYVPIGPQNPSYNAIGYNTEDNFIYGIKSGSNQLVQIDANGMSQSLGAVGGLPNNSTIYKNGDFDVMGNYYITTTTTLYVVDVSTAPLTAQSLPITGGTMNPGDVTFNPVDNLIHAVSREGLIAYTLDPTTGNLSSANLAGPITNSDIGFGAAWSNVDGDFFVSNNPTGNIFQIDLNTNNSTLVAQGTPTSNNDGASCSIAVSSFTEDTPSLCNDGIDNDGDGLIDCEDPDCNCTNNCQNSNLGVLISPQPSYTTCAVSNNGTLDAIAFNGVPGYTYAWSNGGNTASISGLGVGVYSVTVTDTNGCTSEATGTVELHPEGVWLMTSTTAACGSTASGTAHVSAMLGTAPYTYLWSNGQTTEDATGLAIGDHTVTVTDALGCQAVATVTIVSGPAISLFTTASYETCAGSNDATATVIASNGVPPYTYLWSDGQTTDIAVGLGAGSYGVTVTDANGCSNTATQEVELSPEGIWIMVSGTDADCGSDNGTAHVGVMTGVPPYTFIWDDPAMQTTADPVGLAPGTYSVTVTDSNGCTAVGSVTIGTNGTVLTVTISSTNVDCTNLGSATANVSNGSGGYTYSWSNGAITQSITDLMEGTYTVDVTDNSTGCFGSASVTIIDECNTTCDTDPGSLTPNPVDACVDAGSSVNLSAVHTVGNVPAGYQTVYLLTSGAGLVIQATNGTPDFTVTGPGLFTIHTLVYDPATFNLGIIVPGVTTGFDINALLIQGGGTICASLDLTGAAFTLYDNPTVSINGPYTVCPGASVQMTATVSGGGAGITYAWSATGGSFDDPASASPLYTMMTPGTYTITLNITDANGCTASATTEVTVNNALNVDITPSNVSVCMGESVDFSVNTSGTGLTYMWSATGGTFDDPNSASPTYTMMMPGTYTISVDVTDSNGCMASASTEVTVNSLPGVTVSPAGNTDICAGESLAVSATASGNAPYTYSWTATGGTFDDPTSATPNYSMMMPGTYTLTVVVTDANGCTASASLDVTVNPSPSVSISPLDASSCGAASIDFTATVNGGGGTNTYLWTATGGAFSDPTSATPTYTMMMTGTYTISVVVTDINGCDATASTSVTVYPEITSCSAAVTSSYFEGVDISTLGGSDGSAAAMVTGGTAPYTYLWSDGQTTQEATGLSAGTYTVTITDAGGCTCEASVTLMDPAKLGNFVWEDVDQDGIQNPNHPVIEGVKVTLNGTSNTGIAVMRMMNTGPDGMYMFDGLLPGDYKVTFDTPTGFTGTRPNWGVDDTVDSDADPAMGGMTQTVSLSSGEYNPTLDAGFYLCSNIGDYVWYDIDHSGTQDPTETGVEGVQVKLLMAGIDGVFCTADDIIADEQTTGPNGEYLFECVTPGEYIVSFMNLPTDWTFSDDNQGGDDALDSDADPITGKTDPFTVVYGQPDDLTIDAGIRPICDQFTGGGGEIANNGTQPEICPGEIPYSIINISAPTGGNGPIEYLWMSSTVDVPFDTNYWKPIPGAPATLDYQPGPLNETTWFIRCARRLDCPYYVESNTVKICVKDPQDCPAPFTSDALQFTADVASGDQVQLNWEMGPELDTYNFFIERSFDGVYWSEIGNRSGKGDHLRDNYYDHLDKGARRGVNFYRIRVVGLTTGINYSQVEQIRISEDILAKLYPNPFIDRLNLEPIQSWESDGTIEVFDISGKILATYDLAQGKEIVELSLGNIVSSGVFLVRVTYTDSGKTTTFKVQKND